MRRKPSNRQQLAALRDLLPKVRRYEARQQIERKIRILEGHIVSGYNHTVVVYGGGGCSPR